MADLAAGAARRWAALVYRAMIEAHLDATNTHGSSKLAGPGYRWPVEFVQAWITEAANTDRRLPLAKDCRPPKMASWWPEVVRSRHEAYGMDRPRNLPSPPSPLEIQRLYAISEWFDEWLTKDTRRLVWARAHRYTWPQLAKLTGISERALRYQHADAILVISQRLSATRPRQFPFVGDPD